MKANQVSSYKDSATPIFDVRSPSEFVEGHIPNAINLPLFSDAERAEVGTLYKQVGKDAALEKGLEHVGPRIQAMVQKAKKASPHKKAIVYCWRGGMRSEAVQWLLEFAGFSVQRIEGGYKAYRREVAETIEKYCTDAKWQVIGGMTGCGKTEILAELSKLGAQVIDLEDLANHRGSAFGHFLLEEQPSTEHFMNLLHAELVQLDLNKTIWIEDESRMIGNIVLPPSLTHAIAHAPIVVVEKSREERTSFLAEVYGKAQYEDFETAFHSIKKKLDGPLLNKALEHVKNKELKEAAAIAFHYYDKAYMHGLTQRREKHQQFQEVYDAANQSFEETASQLKRIYNDG